MRKSFYKPGIGLLEFIFAFALFFCVQCHAGETMQKSKDTENSPGTLYARSAVLMDGSSGRVLYEKNGEEFLANASTTKILTCILALENAELTEVVKVSSYAASMPDVQLHIREGEQYYLKDLLYSLMLESHNDVAVAVAEHISGSQEEFAKLMNEKAKEIGCKNTTFLTPNGLDATGKIEKQNEIEEKSHGTTASDLALMMRYCIKVSPKKEAFLQITQTPSYSFQNIAGNRNFTCRNHNAFLNIMEGVISGKTGFTSKAGYCYVGALEQNGECYIVALLACGWPGNKNYKWSDCRKMMEYGLKEYELYQLEDLEKNFEKELETEVKDAKRQDLGENKRIVLKRKKNEIQQVLLKQGEKIEVKVKKRVLAAPVETGEKAGELEYYIEGEKWLKEELYCGEKIEKIDLWWCLTKITKKMSNYK